MARRLFIHGLLRQAVLAAVAVAAFGACGAAETPRPEKRLGLYLHACWPYQYPYAIRTWGRADYDAMFQLLRRMDYDAAMLWPTLEAVPAPLGAADRARLEEYRTIIDDGRRRGLEIWLAQCAALTCAPEMAAVAWQRRNLYGGKARTIRLDDPVQAEPYWRHRAEMLGVINNADAYVTIDGDPGGYPGANPAEFLEVFRRDRRALDRVGARPEEQKLIAWIWCGWGTKGVWKEPIAPFIKASLDALAQGMPEPWQLLAGRSRLGHANDRVNLELTRQAGLMPRSTLFLYEAIEYEPAPPAGVLQFDEIRAAMKKELESSADARGWFGNVQTPLLVLPNVYFFARAARDPSYLDRSDAEVLGDFSAFLGGPAEVLVPAWSCLRLGLDELPADLPDQLRGMKLRGAAAEFLPGGQSRYLDLLARQADSRLRLLQACSREPASREDAVAAVVKGAAALVDWWKSHRYVQESEDDAVFRWRFVNREQYRLLREWCVRNVPEPQGVAPLVVAELVRRDVLARPNAERCVAELLGSRPKAPAPQN